MLTCITNLSVRQMREGEAPSYFNPIEAATVLELVSGLLAQHAQRGGGVTVDDVGVIATYRKQVGGHSSAKSNGQTDFSIGQSPKP
jgi:AAA domain